MLDWVTNNVELIDLLLGLGITIIAGLWAIYMYRANKRSGDKNDEMMAAFVRQNEKILEMFANQLDQNNLTIQEKDALIKDRQGALEVAQQITKGGGPLAQEAKQTLDDLAAGNLGGNGELATLDILAKKYEDTHIQDAALIYLGRGALSFDGDTHGALAAYQRAAELRPENMQAHNQIGRLQARLGNMDAAQAAYERVLELADAQRDKQGRAIALGNLGTVVQMRGELDEAVVHYEQSLALNQELGRKEGMAATYGNLGVVAQTRGDLDAAVAYYQQSLALNQELGRKEGMASQYGNLGNVAATRGELDTAVSYYEQSLALNEELGRKEGIASVYGNLGNVAGMRGDLDMAVRYYEQSLALNEELGSKEGIASVYGNLGNVAGMRGEVDRARAYWAQSRDLYAQVGIPHRVEQVQRWIDDLDGRD